ncbi:reverse transcriptase domain-containing protein [Vibrio caribbeanicus]|uniref:reverse transcriptase domain-containing protein n=1 Tax=Vibrio caribbeanicus TaxID=701175 RepID=UPI00228436F4|nr:reverse transcriptase domain-containing protein [Vibrio caribbeanicus]MCY9845981.1 reverse transcriptase domain-containing protein [Vibrio caribbeanicus]
MQISSVKNLDDLALCLGVSKKVLAYFAYYAPNEKKYKTFNINKKGGGSRTITAPTPKLKEIQLSIYHRLEPYYKPRKSVHGYVKNKSILSNAKTHVGQRWLGKVDVKSYFPSISVNRVVGLLRSEPFNLPNTVAAVVALLVTVNGSLPMSSPCSPVISNLISRRMDAKLNSLSREYKCYYTRYADDIFFSTNRKVFPRELIYHNEDGVSMVGFELEKVFDEEGFTLNSDKVSLKDKSQRQIVTGIVVNERVNIPREYMRELRAMLYAWEKHGLESAEAHWLKKYVNNNRFGENAPYTPRYRRVVRGKLNHIAAIRGTNDEVYLKYAKRLAQVDDTFRIDPKAIAASVASEIKVYVEGKTDAVHLRAAMHALHEGGKYTSLKLTFPNEDKAKGDSELIKSCRVMAGSSQSHLTICLFDSDIDKTTKEMKGSTLAYKDHGNNVYSVVMPTPNFRDDERICIEHLYKDEHLMLKTFAGLRIFKKDEFNKHNGLHVSERGIIKLYPKKETLIVDSDVIDVNTGNNCALSKAKFAEMVERRDIPFDKLSFDGFEPLFDIFEKLHSDYIK